MPRIVAALQARLSSSRLPGKVLKPLAGAPMLARQIERIGHSQRIDRLVVATSDAQEDAAIAALADSLGVACHRGSLEDVLDRMLGAVAPFSPDYVVRLTGDCPLADWTVIDRVIDAAVDGGFDYASNTITPTWPDGLDVEVARFDALARAGAEATAKPDREHVTPYINRQPDLFRLHNVANSVDLSALRWTVDEPADFELVERIYSALYPANPRFLTDDILALLRDHPDWMNVNAGFQRNEGYINALARWNEQTKP
ncbi:MAG: cytidylyltransferase domain-containing protein [Beijerinckiaceae bacterium]